MRKVLSPHLNDKCRLTDKQLAIGKFYNAANKIYREDPEKKNIAVILNYENLRTFKRTIMNSNEEKMEKKYRILKKR